MIRILLTILLCWGSISLYAQRNTALAELDKKYTSGLFRGDNAYILAPMYDQSATSNLTVFQYLQARVPGLQIYGAGSFSPIPYYRMGVPALFLDEMRVDAQTLSSINMNDIAMVKVFRTPFIGSFNSNGGAIAVYTKDGDEE